MARLPSEKYLIQQVGEDVILFEDHTEREIVRFNINNRHLVAQAQKDIYASELSGEDKAFAHFWAGYFYGIAVWGVK